MASKHQMTGMLGVYLTAAELTRRDLIVSITSRNAKGADLLATDQSYKNTWSIQVKTNRKPAGFWLLGKDYKEDVGDRHVYVFVNLRGDERPEYFVVPSRHVAPLGARAQSGMLGTVPTPIAIVTTGRSLSRSSRDFGGVE